MSYLSRLVRTSAYLASTSAPWTVYGQWAKWDRKRRGGKAEEPKAGEFAQDWFSRNTHAWQSLFESASLLGRPIDALEIGSFEGRSAVFLLSLCQEANLTCVDTWTPFHAHVTDMPDPAVVEARFDANTTPFKDRVTKWKGSSLAFWQAQENAREMFDFIYVDGSHYADDVMVDALHSFRLLRPGGLLIFDDYLYRRYDRSLDNPAVAINCFLTMKKGQYSLAAIYHQAAIMKLRSP